MNKVMRVSKALMRVSIALVVLTCAGLLYGQATNSGDITGTVTDPTGAVLPGVAITVLDVDKDVTRNIVTNDSGLYDTGSIPADHYLLTFVKQGFETLKRGPLTISVGMTGVNVQLSVGQESQQVVVTSEVPLLETASSEVSSTLPSDVITELPQTGGLYPDWTNFIALQPGTSGTAQNGTNAINGGMQTSANGSLPYSTGLFDGQTSNSPMSDNVIMTPIFDAIAEVKVSDSLFSAQYGLGGVLYNQNNIFNAASYGFGNGSVGVQRYNDIGGNVGGPIPLPLVHKKLFFFFGNERVINHSSGSQGIITVPDDAMRAGDFTGLATIYDPAVLRKRERRRPQQN